MLILQIVFRKENYFNRSKKFSKPLVLRFFYLSLVSEYQNNTKIQIILTQLSINCAPIHGQTQHTKKSHSLRHSMRSVKRYNVYFFCLLLRYFFSVVIFVF